MFSESKMAGPGYIILNVIRVLNVISLLLVAVASWIMIVETVKTSGFYFFDGVSHFITSVIAVFLIVSEVNLFQSYFARNWPLLSLDHGFVFLGTSMAVIGFNTLGNLNKPATSVEKLGLPLWRIVISGGILAAVMGFANIIATYLFCDNNLGISGRQVRSDGAAIPREPMKTISLSSGSTRRTPSVRRPESPALPSYHEPTEDRRRSRFPFRLPVRMSKNLSISKPVLQDPEQFAKWDESRASPIMEHVQRPPTAMHPAYGNHGIDHEYPAPPPIPVDDDASRYSVTSRVTHPFLNRI